MSGISVKCAQPTLTVTSNVISSPASADGPTRSGSPDGRTTDLFGQAVAPVSHSPLRVAKRALTIRATSGLFGEDLSPSGILQQSLESRLRTRLIGSPLCMVIWRRWTTPWGAFRSRPHVRTRTTFGIVIGLWPTANVPNGGRSPRRGSMTLSGMKDGTKRQIDLQETVRQISLALWPTATASDHKSRSASQATLSRNSRPLRELIFAFWPTLRASDGEKGGPNMSFGAGGQPLPSAVSTVARSSNAPMENGVGSLHPEFAGWELGYPPEFLACAPSVTRSTRGQRRSS